jgi:acyl-coenzyme A synthetase/AMP-(fatty) acid ligase
VSRTIAEVLRPALGRRPDAPAIVARSGTLTYAGLDRAASAAAGAMWQLGVRPGDRVAACLPNDLGVAVAFHGAQRIGAIWAGINEAFAPDEQQALADLAAPALILAGPRSQARGGTVVGTAEWGRLVADAPAPPPVRTGQDVPAGIAFTSGTTGVPKGSCTASGTCCCPARSWSAPAAGALACARATACRSPC